MGLTPLQEAAIKRIHFFQEALEAKGIFVRFGLEQEFLVESDGQAANNALKRDDVQQEIGMHDVNYRGIARQLQNTGNWLLYEMESEFASMQYKLRVYEAKFDNFSMPEAKEKAKPLDVAHDLYYFRTQNLKQLLETTTSLNSQWHSRQLDPVLRSVPYPDHPVYRNETIGLHANLSLRDKNGYDLFNNAEVERLCALSLLELQYKAGLGFLQNPANLDRLDKNNSAPKNIALGKDMKESGFSLLERQGKKIGSGRYLENRMMGADADPFIVTALELAAVYDMVQNHPDILEKPYVPHDKMEDRATARAWPQIFDQQGHPDPKLEKEWQPWVKRMNEAHELSELLGDKLYTGILEAFGGNEHPGR